MPICTLFRNGGRQLADLAVCTAPEKAEAQNQDAPHPARNCDEKGHWIDERENRLVLPWFYHQIYGFPAICGLKMPLNQSNGWKLGGIDGWTQTHFGDFSSESWKETCHVGFGGQKVMFLSKSWGLATLQPTKSWFGRTTKQIAFGTKSDGESSNKRCSTP